jgi:hypothetical protein
MILLNALAVAQAADSIHDQSGVPIEVQPTDPALAKIVLVAGKPSHGPGEHEYFAGCALLMQLLKQTPGVFAVMAKNGWPNNPDTLAGARSVVFFMNGGGNHSILQKDHPAQLQRLIDEGAGFVNLHFTVEYPKAHGEQALSWLGGYYEKDYSTNPMWIATVRALPEHPITRGVRPFSVFDEWYFNLRFVPEMKGVTPILEATPPDVARGTPAAKEHPGRKEVLAWAYERPNGGRSFGFTGLHYHQNWNNDALRRLIVNAILWSAHLEVPAAGASVQLDKGDLLKHLDRKPAKKKQKEPASPNRG